MNHLPHTARLENVHQGQKPGRMSNHALGDLSSQPSLLIAGQAFNEELFDKIEVLSGRFEHAISKVVLIGPLTSENMKAEAKLRDRLKNRPWTCIGTPSKRLREALVLGKPDTAVPARTFFVDKHKLVGQVEGHDTSPLVEAINGVNREITQKRSQNPWHSPEARKRFEEEVAQGLHC